MLPREKASLAHPFSARRTPRSAPPALFQTQLSRAATPRTARASSTSTRCSALPLRRRLRTKDFRQADRPSRFCRRRTSRFGRRRSTTRTSMRRKGSRAVAPSRPAALRGAPSLLPPVCRCVARTRRLARSSRRAAYMTASLKAPTGACECPTAASASACVLRERRARRLQCDVLVYARTDELGAVILVMW